jgi:regulator of Ty1 transposition protein 103
MAAATNLRAINPRSSRSAHPRYVLYIFLNFLDSRTNSIEIDRARSSGRKPLLGGSVFSTPAGASAPAELQPLVPKQIAVSKAALAIENSVPTANTEYTKLMDSQASPPPAPVHAARLSAMLKTLANAEGAVSESIKARRDLISGLEKLLETNRTSLASEEAQSQEIVSRKATVEAKKREVEDAIVRGLSTETSTPARDVPGRESSANGNQDVDRPQIEALTPPPVEALTPTGSPPGLTQGTTSSQEQMVRQLNPTSNQAPLQAGFDLLSSLSLPPARTHVHNPSNGNPPNKKRKIEPDLVDYSATDAMEDLDEDVAELLRAESGGH